jgi:hypothetical protein
MSDRAFRFEVDDGLRPWSRLFLVHPELASVRVEDGWLSAWMGRWSIATPVTNIAEVTMTGPYRWWKVAGPAHVSVADRGLTLATATGRGVCVSFVEPVRGFEPTGTVRHPALTVTVADPDGLMAAVVKARDDDRPAAADPPVRSFERAGMTATIDSLRSWYASPAERLRHRRRVVGAIDPPPRRDTAVDDAQPFADGTGPGFHRRYSVRISGADRSATEAMESFRERLDRAVDDDLAPVTKLDGELGVLEVGDRYVLAISGPWNAPVEVVACDANGLRFATLRGHLEAGVIDFEVRDDGDDIVFTIESWARNGDRVMQVLYDVIGVARSLQGELWVSTCERFVRFVAGRQVGAVEVLTERSR